MLEQLLSNSYFILLAAGGAVFCASYIFFSFIIRVYSIQKQEEGDEIIVTETSEGLMKSFLPMARTIGKTLRALMQGDDKTKSYHRFAENVERRLIAAGRPEGLVADEYIGFGVLYGLLWSVLIMSSYVLLYPEEAFTLGGVYVALFSFLVGCLLWRSWLSNKLNQRQTSIRKQLPFSLDLLTLAMEAGLDFTSALSRIVLKIGKSPLGQEFSLMLHEIQLGKTRSDALRDFAERCNVQEVRTVVASLVQAEELGSSLGVVLRIQAAQQREQRSQRAEEKAMKAPVKMLFPMVFILMALMLIIGSPILITYVTGGE